MRLHFIILILLAALGVLGYKYVHLNAENKILRKQVEKIYTDIMVLEKMQLQFSRMSFYYLQDHLQLKKYLPKMVAAIFADEINSLIDANKHIVNEIKKIRSQYSDNKNHA